MFVSFTDLPSDPRVRSACYGTNVFGIFLCSPNLFFNSVYEAAFKNGLGFYVEYGLPGPKSA